MKTVMLVEDNHRLRKNLQFMLKREGYDAIGVENGKQALAHIHEQRPDLIVTDVIMPDMNGYELLSALRALESTLTIPVVFLTSKGSMSDIRTGMMLGADDYLTKPVDFQELVRVINTRISQHERQRLNLAAQTESVQRHLMAILPHELRTPISGIVGAANIIRSEIDSLTKEEIFELNESILSSSQRLTRITENFMLYARVRSQLENPAFVPIVTDKPLENAHILLREVMMSLADNYSRADDIAISLDNTIPGVKQSHILKAVSEIWLNALTFSAVGTPVQMTSRTLNGMYIIDITNQGRGMTEEQINQIKQPLSTFIQFDRSYFEQQGTGLGFALTRSIISLYNGYFDIESDSTHTKVSIGFPLYKS